jgi:hypothetical protein
VRVVQRRRDHCVLVDVSLRVGLLVGLRVVGDAVGRCVVGAAVVGAAVVGEAT